MDALLLLAGLGLLLVGGHLLVSGAGRLATLLGISPLVVGLTVVAFGTSAPELAVNLSAALRGSGELAFGNVIGSNLANIGLILGVAVLIRPLAVEGSVILREIPMMLLATVAAAVLAADGWLRDQPGLYDRADGLLLLLLFAVFLYALAGDVLRGKARDPLLERSTEVAPAGRGRSLGACALWILAGLAGLMGGGYLSVEGAVGIARQLGLSEAVIGLTIVAVGTSLPELVASTVAATRGAADIAIGNVVGSNIFNLLFILGISGTVRPVEVPAAGGADLLALLAISACLLPLAITHQRRLVRGEGALLLALWVGYTAWRVAGDG